MCWITLIAILEHEARGHTSLFTKPHYFDDYGKLLLFEIPYYLFVLDQNAFPKISHRISDPEEYILIEK